MKNTFSFRKSFKVVSIAALIAMALVSAQPAHAIKGCKGQDRPYRILVSLGGNVKVNDARSCRSEKTSADVKKSLLDFYGPGHKITVRAL